MVMAPTRSCEPCHFADNCWRPLCPYTHPGNGRCKKWAAVWGLLAEQENAHHSPPKILQIRRRDFCVTHWERIPERIPERIEEPAVLRAAPAPVIEYAEPAVTETAPAQAVEYVAPAPAVSYAAPAPVIEYAAEPAVTYTAPVPVNENVASAPGDEELVDLPEEDKVADPLRRATIKRVLDGVVYYGEVEEIEKGNLSHDRLYRVKYTDGDIEHFIADQVKEMSCPLQDVMLAKQAQATHDHLARNVRAPEDRRNAEHIVNALKRYTSTGPVPMSQHVTLAPAVTYGSRAPVIEPMAPVPAFTDTAPVPVSEHVTPALAVTSGSRAPVIGLMAAVPAVTDTAPAPVNGNVAASEMETAIQEVSDLLASGLGEGDPEFDAAWARLIELGARQMAKKKAKRKKR